MEHSAQQSYDDLRAVESAARRERLARKAEFVAVLLLFFGLVAALFFPDFRSGVTRNPLILGWYSAFVVLDAATAYHCLRRIRRAQK